MPYLRLQITYRNDRAADFVPGQIVRPRMEEPSNGFARTKSYRAVVGMQQFRARRGTDNRCQSRIVHDGPRRLDRGGVASWSDQGFPLNAAVVLLPGHTVQAQQISGGQTSPLGPGVTIQKKPPSIGPLAFQSHLYECGRCVWLVGAVPGADVALTVGGSPRGSGVSSDGNARIGLTQKLGLGEVLAAQQTACGMTGPMTNGPPADPVPGGPNGACHRRYYLDP